jgi:hypothetical protein
MLQGLVLKATSRWDLLLIVALILERLTIDIRVGVFKFVDGRDDLLLDRDINPLNYLFVFDSANFSHLYNTA